MGQGKCQDAYAALQSEEVLGFTIGAFYSNTVTDNMGHINGVPVINTEEALWLQSCSDDTQFIVALEFDEHVLRDYWLKILLNIIVVQFLSSQHYVVFLYTEQICLYIQS